MPYQGGDIIEVLPMKNWATKIILDKEASKIITQSIKELEAEKNTN